jgi:hypothetical protein
MLHNLTDEERERLVEFRDKWLEIGMSTAKCDREAAEHHVKQIYKAHGFEIPPIYWADSPLGALDLFAQLELSDSDYRDYDKRFKAMTAEISSFCYGFQDANWLAFYDFFDKVINLESVIEVRPYCELAKDCGWWLPYKEAIILTEKPEQIHFNAQDVLHNSNGPAVKFRDGVSIFVLNGILVEEHYVTTPINEFDPRILLHETNAEKRRELVRRIGIERICQKLNSKTIDTDTVYVQEAVYGNRDSSSNGIVSPSNIVTGFKEKTSTYDLILLDLGDGRERPFLKMRNPSLEDVYHIEGVPPGIKTVREALNWRNGMTNERRLKGDPLFIA